MSRNDYIIGMETVPRPPLALGSAPAGGSGKCDAAVGFSRGGCLRRRRDSASLKIVDFQEGRH